MAYKEDEIGISVEDVKSPDPNVAPPKFVKTKQELAKFLGVSRPTLDQWIKKPGCPQVQPEGYDVLGWLVFAGQVAKRADVGSLDPKRKLELKILTEKYRALLRSNDQADGDLIRASDVTSTIIAVVSELRGYLKELENTLPSRVSGLDVVDTRLVLMQAFDGLMGKVYNGKLGTHVKNRIDPDPEAQRIKDGMDTSQLNLA